MTNDNIRQFSPANDSDPPAPDHEPAFNLPPGVAALGAVMLLVLLAVEYLLPPPAQEAAIMTFGFVPARWSGGMPLGIWSVLSPVAHMFLHGGWLHLGVNLGMLMAFGSALERGIGLRRFLIIFILSGIAGVMTHFVFFPQDVHPLIGASGGLSGLFGAVIVLMQRQGMMTGGWRVLAPFIAVWVVISLFFGFFGMPGAGGAIAWTAHIGGFIAGLLLLNPLLHLHIRD